MLIVLLAGFYADMKTILILCFVNFIIHLVDDCCRVGAKIRRLICEALYVYEEKNE